MLQPTDFADGQECDRSGDVAVLLDLVGKLQAGKNVRAPIA